MFGRFLRRPSAPVRDRIDRQRIDDAAGRIVGLNPHLRMARRSRERLAPALTTTLRYLDGVMAKVPPARMASAGTWNDDPYIHAFFVAATDVAPVLSRAIEVRACFARYPALTEVYALLGMAMIDKHILGAALEGETLRRDVVQQTVSFSDHQVRVCAPSEAELRQEIVRRLVEQYGLAALRRVAADESRREILEQERALLKTRLTLLEREGVGVRGVLGGDEPTSAAELARLHEQVADNQRALERLGIRSEAIERTLGQVIDVLSEPGAILVVENRPLRLSRTNVVLPDEDGEGEAIEVPVARVPPVPNLMRAFSLVRFARAELQAVASPSEQAARLLG
ncbi:hypothetical protein [Massilia horti]|uniref:Uncharacterized protein n=1 Tax=Massilia horti TaxID=2562153 RepID=A0A4Y9SNR9_9BURK|nr:hypothetical protein [Massilia horti]TFW27157.1 hypothetical protein E4O92_24535 [Massilia horti]